MSIAIGIAEPTSYERDLWVEELHDPHCHQFTVALSELLPRSIDLVNLKRVAEQVLESEQASHKSFHEQEGHLVLKKAPVVVCAELYEFKNEDDFALFFNEWSRKIWDLSVSPLVEIAIGQTDQATILMVRAHHIVADGWGLNLLSKKILGAYADNHLGLNEQLKGVKRYATKYPTLQGSKLDEAIHDVVVKIADTDPVLFPKSGATLSTSPSYIRPFKISAHEVAHGIENGFTPFLAVSTALAVLLSNAYGSEKFFIGVPFLNRTDAEITSVSHRANILPVKVEVLPQNTLRAIYSQIKDFIVFLKDKESVPLGGIISALASSSRQLFDVTMSYLRYPEWGAIAGFEEKTQNIAHIHTQDAIAIHLYTYGNNADVWGDVCLNSSVFDTEDSANAFLDTFIHLIDNFGNNVDKRVSEVNLLTSKQMEQLRQYENGPTKQYSVNETVVSLFEAKAEQFPDNIALRDQTGTSLSYSQLNAWSSTIAAALEERGIGQGDIVAVSVERSPEMLAAIFGVLKTGAAYLPIDSDYPEDRIQYMLNDSNAKLVISNLPHVMKSDDPRLFRLDALPTELPSHYKYRSKAQPHEPAYVIYTSGSTGRPKGVIVEHHSVVNRLEWMQEIHPLTSEDVILQKTSISFDVSVWELFWWAMTGASVALLKQGAQRDPRELIQAIAAHGVTVAHFVPSMFEPYVQTLIDDRQTLLSVSRLKCLFTSGEALTPAVVNKYRKLFSHDICPPRLINLYGPTEATVDVTYYELNLEQDSDINSVPIGFPINNTSVRIASLHGVRQPIGIPGELQIGGVQLARGYLNRPELTAERFIIDQNDSCSRWYRTGDLAAWAEDGSILYLGRMDGQVKIRGNRIELGEIKNALLNLPEVLNAEVIVEDDARGKHLIAVYVGRRDLNERDIRAKLGKQLPSFMVPARFVRLGCIPLTPNGKFDRASALREVSGNKTSPQTVKLDESETIVAKIWEKVLGRSNISADDDFYALGGDSILMLKVRSELESHGYGVGLSDLAQYTTVRSLGNVLESVSRVLSSPKEALPPFALISETDQKMLSSAYDDAYPVSQLQLGLLFHSREMEGARTYKDVFRYTLKSAWNEVAFRSALQGLARRHPALRTVFNLSDYHLPLQLIRPEILIDDVLSIETPDVVEYEHTVLAHMDKRSRYNYSFASGPLFHVAIFANSESNYIDLVFSFHHAILDGGSVANLIRELLLSYSQGNDGANLGYPEDELPNPSIFVQNEIEILEASESRNYWKEYLSGATNTLPIGLTGYSTAPVKRIFSYRFLIDPVLDAALNQLARTIRVPIKHLYLAAHCTTIALMSGKEDIVTGVVTHTRPEIKHSERILGLFLNTLPLRVDIKSLNWLQVVEGLYRNEKRSHKHRCFPLSQIQADNELFSLQTAFNYVHFHILQDISAKTGIEIVAFDPKEETNFDILVNVMRDVDGERTSVRMDINGSIYAREQGAVFSRLFNHALERIAYQPEMPVSLSRPITEVGCLVERTSDKAFISLPAMIRNSVQRDPDAVAITYDNVEWSYQQLWDAATEIAFLLSERGVNKQDVVGIALPRSFEQIATVVAILRIGAICLPIDLSYPASRIELILKIANPAVVVTDRSVTELPASERVLFLEYDSIEAVAERDDAAIDSTDAAYILFTSGSTGTPKGVTMLHRGLTNLVGWQNKISSGAKVTSTLQFSPLSFDVSFQEILSTLSSGATLHLISEMERRDPVALVRHLDHKGVERIFLPYIALQQLAETAVMLGFFPKKLRVIVSSGEQLRVTKEIRTLVDNLPGGILENQYGPTETHVVTSYTMSSDPSQFPALPPIGIPITGVGIVILDESSNVVPDGVPGEICVFGEALASGYYRSPEETKKKFIAHADVPGGMFYRTGDIGIRSACGEIISLGRKDTLVKVRGYRVELSEIELKILEFFENRRENVEVAVVARPRDDLDSYLIAYLVGKEDGIALEELRQFIGAELPAYMVPTHITWINELPKTPSGKRDDAMLRKLDIQLVSEKNYRGPEGEYESRLCELTAELLKIPEIAPEQSIFDCGATSLTAMRIVVLVEKLYGINVPLSAFVSAPTIAKLAMLIQDGGGQFKFDPLVPLREAGNRRPLFLVHPMGGNILSYLRMLPHLPSDQPLYALQASGVDAGSSPITTIEEQAVFYIDAIKRIQPTGPYVIGGWSYGGFIAFEMANQLIRSGETVSNVLILDTMALSSQAKGQASDDALLSWFFWELLWTSKGSSLPVHVVPSYIESLQEKFEYITDHATQIGAIPEGSTKAVMQRLFEVYNANWQAAAEYNAQCPNLDVTLIRAKQPLPQILQEMHNTIRSEYHDPLNGWGGKTSGRVNLIEVDGDHLTIMEEPFVGPMVSAIITEINKVKGVDANV
ncbi:putative non-ribosomal peptide synthetase [Xenorhabdus bovienii str. kraussei Quebec]|uniref:Putative non-ribosomal peptide synthetase n=1 Tax=Xenorhabdus bovienii str. kraussei Quebec TaxID=1398203 RepID=A0A077PGU6_XENBV|nr:non-ribosomal peptide synthetase [Xenorhabdus bovienii]CDH19877.1 putative non-ribosomal peptide synthetase [Xenorhabdus bovienii str. kraussei Quebec]